MIKPLHDSVLFVFVDDVAGIGFVNKTKSGIIMTQGIDHATDTIPRWGKVVAIGPDVDTNEIALGKYILIEPLMWTNGFKYDEIDIWKTDTSKVLATTDDINNCIQF